MPRKPRSICYGLVLPSIRSRVSEVQKARSQWDRSDWPHSSQGLDSEVLRALAGLALQDGAA